MFRPLHYTVRPVEKKINCSGVYRDIPGYSNYAVTASGFLLNKMVGISTRIDMDQYIILHASQCFVMGDIVNHVFSQRPLPV